MPENLPPLIQQLGRDHRNMARLLDILSEELKRYKSGETIDFEVVSRIIDYVLNFPELRHHPREDFAYKILKQRDPAVAAKVEGILSEHKELGALTRKFAAAVRNLEHDAEMPRGWFESLFSQFITTYRQHMRTEDEVFFPLAAKYLSDADWKEAEGSVRETEHDPLFGGRIDAEYQSLHDRIIRLAY